MTIRPKTSNGRATRLRSCASPIALILLAGAFAGPAAAQATKPKEFVYFLPKTQISVDVSQRLMTCPQGAGAPDIATTIEVTSEAVADPAAKVVLDARSGTFAKRSVKLGLNLDGTLQSFNSESEGQGGKVLTAIANAAFKLAPMVLGAAPGPAPARPAPPQPGLACTDTAKGMLKALADVGADIAALEARIVGGSATAGEAALLEQRRNQRARIIQGLTLATDSGPIEPTGAAGKNPPPIWIAAVAFARWFSPTGGLTLEQALEKAQVAGRGGFLVTVAPDNAMYEALQTSLILPTAAVPDLIYRRPVPATVKVEPCTGGVGVQCTIDKGPNAAGATGTAAVRLPQLSGLFTIPVGRGGMFGTRQATAKFDAAGAPTVLEYGWGGASADVAGLIDTAAAGVVTLRDAELAELNRQIELEEARQKLAELRNPDTND